MRNRPMWYTLDGHTPRPVHDHSELASDERRDPDWRVVAKTSIGRIFISTVFLALDHSFSDEGPPILFETMVFLDHDSAGEDYCGRCATWEEAEQMHRAAVAEYSKPAWWRWLKRRPDAIRTRFDHWRWRLGQRFEQPKRRKSKAARARVLLHTKQLQRRLGWHRPE